ncbi:exosortase A [Massilia sp. PWRC2]|uniref:exosortase A n=1 Tax=Massilia sp. PWRC2 TaxID=2804626 RepID=UPI003CEEAF36
MNPNLTLEQAPVQRSLLVPALLILIAFVAPFLLYFETARSIVAIWSRSETFAHGFIIPPICLWLVWRQRANFYSMPLTPWWPPVALLFMAGMLWTIAGVADVQVVQQYALVLMIPITALALFGRRLALSLAFPLLFVLAAVPFGEIFIDPLISFTADFTVWCLQLIGMPVLRNGTVFEIPSGNWSVVEACSGVRYLISSVTIGWLYAYLTYRSNLRRGLFVAFAVLVPIVANGLRAFMIVMIGHLSGMRLAVGVDHLIYGWLFFGLVMFLMFWIGNFWREDVEPATVSAGRPLLLAPNASIATLTVALVIAAAIWPALMAYAQQASYNPRPVVLAPPAISWAMAPASSSWEPAYASPDARSTATYSSGAVPVTLHVLYYRNQTRGKSLVSSTNRLTGGEKGAFHETAATLRSELIDGTALPVREGKLKSAGGNILVWQWHVVDGQATVSNVVGKLRQARAKIAGRADDGAAILLSAPYDEHPEQARAALNAFVQANLAPLNAALATTRAR